jgi:hypothetical protein
MSFQVWAETAAMARAMVARVNFMVTEGKFRLKLNSEQ